MKAISTYTTKPQTNAPILTSSTETESIQKVAHKALTYIEKPLSRESTILDHYLTNNNAFFSTLLGKSTEGIQDIPLFVSSAVLTLSLCPNLSADALMKIEKKFNKDRDFEDLTIPQASRFYRDLLYHPQASHLTIEDLTIPEECLPSLESCLSLLQYKKSTPKQRTKFVTLLAEDQTIADYSNKSNLPNTLINYFEKNSVFFQNLLNKFIAENKVSSTFRNLPISLVSAIFTLRRCPNLPIDLLEEIEEQFKKDATKEGFSSDYITLFYTHLFSHPHSIDFVYDSLFFPPNQKEKTEALLSPSSKITIFKDLIRAGKINREILGLSPSISKVIIHLIEKTDHTPKQLLTLETLLRKQLLSLPEEMPLPELKNHIFYAYQALFSHPQINGIQESALLKLIHKCLDFDFGTEVFQALLSPASKYMTSKDLLLNLMEIPATNIYDELSNNECFVIYTLIFEQLERFSLEDEDLDLLMTIIRNSHAIVRYENEQYEKLHKYFIEFIIQSDPIALSMDLIDPRMLWMFLEHQAFQSLSSEDLKQIENSFKRRSKKMSRNVIDRFYQALHSHPSFEAKSLTDS